MRKNHKPLKRLPGVVRASDHPVKTGCYPNKNDGIIETTPCFSMVPVSVLQTHQLTVSTVFNKYPKQGG
jgi:hypothetical protein